MTPTDGVKSAAENLNILDSQNIVDELNNQQSQKFIDPNCHSPGETILDVSNDSFCDDQILDPQNRAKKLQNVINGLPQYPTPTDNSICSQSALTELQFLIQQKFNNTNLSENTAKNNFAEEKFESQLVLTSIAISLVYSMKQVNSKLSNLINSIISAITTTITSIQNIEVNDKISLFEKQHAIFRLNDFLSLFSGINIDRNAYDIRHFSIDIFLTYEIEILRRYTTNVMFINYNNYLININDKITFDQRKSSQEFGGIYESAGNKLIASPTPVIDDYYADIINLKTSLFDDTFNNIKSSRDSNIIKRFAYSLKITPDIDRSGPAQVLNTFVLKALNDLITFFVDYVDGVPKMPTEKDVLTEISSIDFCGLKIPPTPPAELDTTTTNIADLSHNTFDTNNKPTISDLDYWKEYSKYITIVNLLPIYWTIGLYVPTPGGILKVPLPTIWKPLAVINAKPFGLIVIFLTINGIAISPTIWVYKFPPFGKNESNLFVMLRSFNQKIKDDTGNALLNVPVVNNININPELTKTLPFKQDDLPTIKRLGMNNLTYLLYLNQWLSTYTNGGGLP